MAFSDEHLRIAENLRTLYASWLDAAKADTALDARLVWKTVKDKEYLTQIKRGSHTSTSLGPRDEAAEARMEAYLTARREADERMAQVLPLIEQAHTLYKALRLPMVDRRFGAVAREFDVAGLLGASLLVVGTNAMPVYEMEAQTRFATGLDTTNDADFAWRCESGQVSLVGPPGAIMSALRRVDPLFTVNSEKRFQARNSAGYEVEILRAPSMRGAYPNEEGLRPVDLEEQEWLLLGRPVEAVLMDLGRMPVRMVVPDPRWMALHKAWLADKPERNRNKIAKDKAQAERIADAIKRYLPHYPLDEAFMSQVPPALQVYRDRLFA